MATTKDERIYIRVASDVKDDFEILARFKGLKTATFLHSLIVKTIYEARIENPGIFTNVKREKLKPSAAEKPKNLKKYSAKSKRDKSGDAQKTFTTSDGSTIPLYEEADSFIDEEGS